MTILRLLVLSILLVAAPATAFTVYTDPVAWAAAAGGSPQLETFDGIGNISIPLGGGVIPIGPGLSLEADGNHADSAGAPDFCPGIILDMMCVDIHGGLASEIPTFNRVIFETNAVTAFAFDVLNLGLGHETEIEVLWDGGSAIIDQSTFFGASFFGVVIDPADPSITSIDFSAEQAAVLTDNLRWVPIPETSPLLAVCFGLSVLGYAGRRRVQHA